MFNGQNSVPVRHSKIVQNDIVMKEVQSRNWQYVVESLIQLVEGNKTQLKPFQKSEKKIIKSMKHNYSVARRVYTSNYENMAKQFKIYLNSLPPNETDEIENDFRANGKGLVSVRDAQSTMELFHSFAMFYYINGRLPYTDGHLFVPDGNAPSEIIGEKLNLKELFAKFFRTKSNAVVSSPFLAAQILFFAGKETIAKDFLTELYENCRGALF